MAKPWLEAGPVGEVSGAGSSQISPAKVGLGFFIVVAGALFTLFLSAYFMRMQMGDWRPLPVPALLWFNTFVLILSSIALQWARVAANRDEMDGVTFGLLGAGVTSLGFLGGQIIAWHQLASAGYGLASNPANTFFYVLTAAHGLHVLGGIVALGRTANKVWHSERASQVRLSVDLCAIYWHFLLLVWLILFGLLLMEPGDSFTEFLVRCIQLIPGSR
ncbi:cytochrome-c oxidase [Pseudorhodoplanes sinuspersici]|uniref:Cytochrome-c oxidase n=2 Tax=Pseudorhodoplanes sinuspersici TaxID=1235591 RepID=A0A1W6ZZH0_9HYPH|nr:cytochrome-c oxidase [Pseudorhodoplanes sinuspersici]